MKNLKGNFFTAIVVLAAAISHGGITPVVAPQAQPFPLAQVRLLESPFRDAMLRDANYLLSLDTDRLLYNFRINAGLPSSAKPYGGWISPQSEVRGHIVGHYLSACSLMYTSTGMENHAKYGDTIYFHGDGSLYVNLFIPSELSWPEKNLVMRQETKFPERDTTQLYFKTEAPVQLALKIRRPAWAETIAARADGKKQKISGGLSPYFTLDHKWQNRDRVEIQLPMKLHAEPLPGATNIVALLYGPIVLAGELGTNGTPNPYAKDQLDFVKVPDPEVPVFVADENSLLKHIKPEGEPLRFRTKNLGKPDDVTLIPYYKLNDERYSIYWSVVSPADWKENPAKAKAEAATLLQTALNANRI